MNTLCLILDCLHAGFLGPYGNAWIHTPAFDLLASQAFTFDCALADSPRIDCLCDSYWRLKHALAPEPGPDHAPLPARVRAAGLTPVLMTDERPVAEHPLAGQFDERFEVERRFASRAAGELDETHLASCFAQLVDWLEQAPEGFFLWCHLGGLGAAWDAPMEYRRAYSAPGDPEPYSGTEVPGQRLPADYDPDDLFGIVQAYAGQVSLLDSCLAGLLNLLDDRPMLLAVAGLRGFPLGEHLRVGPCDLPLYGELVHLPMFIRSPDGCGAAARSPVLVQPADLSATLLDMLGAPVSGPSPAPSLLPVIRGDQPGERDYLVLAGEGSERAIRTPAWYLRCGEPPELFVKPDDRWEANNVASRCGEILEQLRSHLSHACQDPALTQSTHSPPLAEVLVSGLE
jgi:hypothetical protein